jgi:hypothetical protein
LSKQILNKMKEIIDLEEHAKAGKPVPKDKRYQIRIDREKYVVEEECMTGRQFLQLAGKVPVEKYRLNQKLIGGQVKPIQYNDQVCFTMPGIERFMSLPLDQTEG